MLIRFFFIILSTLVFFTSQNAWADCASPTAVAGARNFNNGGYEICDGTNWQDFYCPDSLWSTSIMRYWKLDETGGTAADSSSGGHTGTIVNSGRFTWMPSGGKIDGAADFGAIDGQPDETQAHINVGTSLTVSALPVSFAAWINITDNNDYRGIIGKRTGGGAGTKFFWLVIDSGQLSFETATDTATFNYYPPPGQWVHLIMVATASDTRLYVNGFLRDTQGVLGFGSGPAGAPVNIGDNGEIDANGSGDGDPWKGRIDDVRIYAEELDAGEVAGLYGSTVCRSLGSCADAGAVEYDSGGNVLRWCNGTNWIGFRT
ncbi:MAG: LamG domain-containing protein [Alphaproteobacteria bacterium PRO2]|nr:LamG domain-containing protein [Alphaproteobacteria bacterium PRO2]